MSDTLGLVAAVAIVAAIVATVLSGTSFIARRRAGRGRTPADRRPDVRSDTSISIAARADLLRSLRRASVLARQLGLGTAIVGMVLANIAQADDGEPTAASRFGVALALVGLLIVWFGPLMLRSRADQAVADHDVSGYWVRRGRRRLLVVVVIAGAYVALAISLSALLAWLGDTSPTVDADSTPGEGPWGYPIGFAGFLVASWAGFRRARQMAQRDADGVRARDPRPPILLLRSFDDDDVEVFAQPPRRGSVFAQIGLDYDERLEEGLAAALDSVGPVIAVQPPGERRRRLGAAREVLTGPDWEADVAERIADASAVVMILGTTPGVATELQLLADGDALDRTAFVLPPGDVADRSRRWEVFRRALPSVVGATQPVPGALVVVLGSPEAVWVTSEQHDAADYEVAIAAAMDRIGRRAAAWAPPAGRPAAPVDVTETTRDFPGNRR